MKLLQRLFPRPASTGRASARDRKASQTSRAMLWPYRVGDPVYTPRNYAALAREGYSLNAVVYACVQEVISRASQITLVLQRGYGKEAETLEGHAALDLLRRPNPQMSEAEFRAAWVGHLLLSGNAYLHGIAPESGPKLGRPLELWPLRPDRMRVLAGSWQEPVSGYTYTDGREVKLAAPDVCHAKLFNPLNDFYGMSPIEAAARGIDQHNASGDWNTAALQNRGTVDTWINMRGQVGPEERESLKRQFLRQHTGPKNARRPMVTRALDGIDVHRLGLSAVELDYLEGRRMSAFEICSAFRVPSQIVGVPGAQTYANMEQAERSLYGSAVIPALTRFCDAMTRWLLPRYPDSEGLYLWYDASEIEALQEDRDVRAQRATRLFTSGIITQRQACREAGVDDDQAEDKHVWELRGASPQAAGAAPMSLNGGRPGGLRKHSPRVLDLLDGDYGSS